MDNEKVTTYAIIFACIVGIVIVAFLVITSLPGNSYFSELYFEDHTELPEGMNAGEIEKFEFTVVSHERNNTVYSYRVSFGNEIVKTGSFNLRRGDNETTTVLLSPQESTLRYVTSDITKVENHFIFNRQSMGKILLVGENGTVREIKANKSEIDLLLSVNNVIWSGEKVQVPVNIPGNNMNSLDLNLNSEENYKFSYNTKEVINTSIKSTPFLSEGELANFSSYGYNLINQTTYIKNDKGDVVVTHESNISKFRYEKKKVEVKVTTDTGKEYEIHFWTIVKEGNSL